MQTVSVTVENGFLLIHRERTLELDAAARILCSRRRWMYTSALRDYSRVVLTQDTARCPFCGRESRDVYKGWAVLGIGSADPRVKSVGNVDKHAVRAWASPQESLFPETLELNHVRIPQELVCRGCGMTSRPMEGYSHVQIQSSSRRITVSCEVTEDLGVLLYFLMKSQVRSAKNQFAFSGHREQVSEVLVFDLRKRRAYLEAYISEERVLVYDLTFSSYDEFDRTEICRLLKAHSVRRALARCFREHLGQLPFGEKDLTPEAFIRLTHYGPFPKCFFEEIPVNNDTGSVDRSFRAVDRFLVPGKVPELLRRSALPGGRSVRRAFYEKPGLCFYIREAEQVWRMVQDVNLFRRFLSDRSCYWVLSILHRLPATTCFFEDYIAARKVTGLLNAAAKEDMYMQRYAVFYSAMTSAAKARERKQWGKQLPGKVSDGGFYVPDPVWNCKAWNTCIGGYTCAVLTGQREFEQAAEDLNNCLAEWRIFSSRPVVGVKQGMTYKAAIEIGKSRGRACVVQARARNNEPVSRGGKKLFAAYLEWADRNGIIRPEDPDDI